MREWQVGLGECLQDVIDCSPAGTVLRLAPGEYRQKLVIRTPKVTICGAGAGQTRIVFADHARMLDDVSRPVGTFRSFTVAVTAPGVTLSDLSIENDAGDPVRNGQQVALSVYGDAFSAERCALVSTQDTLFLGPLPPDLLIRYRDLLPEALCRDASLSSRFTDCRIDGSVDFIFGGGDALFSDCEIRSVADGRQVGYVAAPSHRRKQTEGFRFENCRFTHGEGVAPESIFLARPWRDYGLATFTGCTYGGHIAPAGFDQWGTTDRDRTARFYESPAVFSRVPWVNRPFAE